MPVAVRGVGAVLALDAADSPLLRIDVIQLVDDRIEFRDPGVRAGVEALLPRTVERLIAEAGQGERDQIVDRDGRPE